MKPPAQLTGGNVLRIYAIKWDTDGEEVDLPTEVEIEVDEDQEPADALSDKYGWCVESLGIYFERPILDDRGGSPDNSYHCGNCDTLFDKGSFYPEDTFCCSHCFHRYHGEPCPFECADCASTGGKLSTGGHR